MASGNHGNPLLGGQDEYSVLYDVAMNIDFNNEQASEYDTDLIYEIIGLLYRNPKLTEEELLAMYEEKVLTDYGIETAEEATK